MTLMEILSGTFKHRLTARFTLNFMNFKAKTMCFIVQSKMEKMEKEEFKLHLRNQDISKASSIHTLIISKNPLNYIHSDALTSKLSKSLRSHLGTVKYGCLKVIILSSG